MTEYSERIILILCSSEQTENKKIDQVSERNFFMKKIIPISLFFILSLSLLYRLTIVSASEQAQIMEVEAPELINSSVTMLPEENVPKSMPTFTDEDSVQVYEKLHNTLTPDLLPLTIKISSSMDYPSSIPINSHTFFLYTPAFVTENTPLIVACHGYCDDEDEMSGYGNGNFALYTLVYHSYHPNAMILFPTKDYHGEWIPEDIAKLTRDFVSYYNLQGNVYYYGFSQGCLNGPDIIQKYGNYKAAVFVDEDFIAYPYPTKECPPRGVNLSLTQLSSLSAFRICGCTYVDTYTDRCALATLLENKGILYTEEVYPPNTYEHLEVSSLTAQTSIDWLLSIK